MTTDAKPDYKAMTDEELNRAVAETFPDHGYGQGGYLENFSSHSCGCNECGNDPVDFAGEPAAWGWLLEVEGWINLAPDRDGDGQMSWSAGHMGNASPSIDAVDDKPGRAIAIAYLKSRQ